MFSKLLQHDMDILAAGAAPLVHQPLAKHTIQQIHEGLIDIGAAPIATRRRRHLIEACRAVYTEVTE